MSREEALDEPVDEGSADRLAGHQRPVIDRPDKLVDLGRQIEPHGEQPAVYRAFERRPVAAALFVEVPGAEDLGELRVVLGVPEQRAEDRTGVRPGEQAGHTPEVAAEVVRQVAGVGRGERLGCVLEEGVE
jgi:hypothetical protein